mgnify:CR=1 FL=1
MGLRFKQEPIDLKCPELEQVTTDAGRYYITPDGNKYSSVTTIIGAMSDKTWLEEWKERVGEREAERVSRQAALRGTQLHELAETWVLNRDVNVRALMPLQRMLFNQIKKSLEPVDIVYGSELRLYSNRLKSAGSCDLFCKYAGKKTVLDFKTSRNPKEEEDILGYFIQCAMYAYMMFEMTGIMFPQIAVVISCDASNDASVFVKPTRDYLPQAVTMCDEYQKLIS